MKKRALSPVVLATTLVVSLLLLPLWAYHQWIFPSIAGPPAVSLGQLLCVPALWLIVVESFVLLVSQPSPSQSVVKGRAASRRAGQPGEGSGEGDTRETGSMKGIYIGYAACTMSVYLYMVQAICAGGLDAAPPWWRTALFGGVGALSLGYRIWCVRVLGAYFTAEVRTTPQQRLITAPPYDRVRHPSYTGAILLGLTYPPLVGLDSALALVGYVAVMAAVYTWRIMVEERAMAKRFGDEHKEWRKHTGLLLPLPGRRFRPAGPDRPADPGAVGEDHDS